MKSERQNSESLILYGVPVTSDAIWAMSSTEYTTNIPNYPISPTNEQQEQRRWISSPRVNHQFINSTAIGSRIHTWIELSTDFIFIKIENQKQLSRLLTTDSPQIEETTWRGLKIEPKRVVADFLSKITLRNFLSGRYLLIIMYISDVFFLRVLSDHLFLSTKR